MTKAAAISNGSRALTLGDLAHLTLGLIFAAVVTWYGWGARGMEGILPNYQDYKSVILAGFDPAAATRLQSPTFPMWGYGWVFLLTENKALILTLQQLLGLVAGLMLVRHVGRTGMPERAVLAFRVLLLVSVPLYALHALRWPYSIASSLIVISLVLGHRGILGEPSSRPVTVLSGLLFGLAVNFRADYFLMPVGLAFAMWIEKRCRRRAVHVIAWLACIYVMLVPWMLYTKHVTGHVLLTSTNGGANLFAGLGNLPGNKWGITMSDGDPVMHEVLAREVGPNPQEYVSYAGDRVLKREFLRRIKDDPSEYARKCLNNLVLIASSGCYAGEFVEPGEPRVGVRGLFATHSWPMSRHVILYSFLLLPVTIFVSWRKRSTLLAGVALVILYQTSLNMLGGFLSSYTTLIYVFHLLNLVYALAFLFGFDAPSPRVAAPPATPSASVPAVAPGVELTILLPVRNEGANLEVMLKVLKAVVEAEHEVIVVCDDPKDTSIPVVESAREAYPQCRLVLNDRGRGILNALASGVSAARGRYVLIFAADEIGPVLALGDMLALAREGCDFVSVTRYAHGGRRLGGSRIGGLLSRLANALFWLSGGAFTDSTTGIKLFRRDVFERLGLDSTVGWSVAFQMAINAQLAGLRLGEVPIASIDRLYGGESTFRLGPWTKQYMKLFLGGLARARELRRARTTEVRVRIPGSTSPSSDGDLVAAGGLLGAWLGPSVVWGACLLVPNLRVANYLGLLCAPLLSIGLTLLARHRRQAVSWVALSALALSSTPLVTAATIAGGALAFLFRGRRWETPERTT